MDKLKEEKPNAEAEADFEVDIRRESEEALRRFRAGDFAGKLKSRLEAPLPKQPSVLFRRTVLAPALGLLVLAAGALAVFFFVARSNERVRVEAGVRQITEALSRFELLPLEARPEAPTGRSLPPFAEALFRKGGGPEAGSETGTAGPAAGGAPLRPLFSPNERFKILYEDRVILKVLTAIANQKEV